SPEDSVTAEPSAARSFTILPSERSLSWAACSPPRLITQLHCFPMAGSSSRVARPISIQSLALAPKFTTHQLDCSLRPAVILGDPCGRPPLCYPGEQSSLPGLHGRQHSPIRPNSMILSRVRSV